jgi:IS4 transposase
LAKAKLSERFLTRAKPLERHGTLLQSVDVDVDLFDRRRLVVAPGKRRYVRKIGDGFRIIDDAEVMLASKGDSRLPIPLRRIRIGRDKGGIITLITNDLKRTAVEIATLYKVRWQIELLSSLDQAAS